MSSITPQEQEFDLLDLLRMARRRKWLIIIPTVTYVLGWPGALLFLMGILMFLPQLRTSGRSESAVFVHTASAIVVGLGLQLVFINTVIGVTGVVFWSFLGLALAGKTSRARSLRDACTDLSRKS